MMTGATLELDHLDITKLPWEGDAALTNLDFKSNVWTLDTGRLGSEADQKYRVNLLAEHGIVTIFVGRHCVNGIQNA